MKDKLKKYLLPNLPYLFFVYLFDKLCQTVRLAPGLDTSEKLLHIGQGFQTAFASSAPSFHALDICVGILGAVLVRLAVYVKGKNAKKYGLDFALKKDTSGEHTRYLVFFKGQDADVITAAFREFSAKNLSREKAPSIRRKLEKAQEQSKTQHKEQERGEKIKTRERSVER